MQVTANKHTSAQEKPRQWYPPPPPLSCPPPGRTGMTVPRHPLGDGCRVTPNPPLGLAKMDHEKQSTVADISGRTFLGHRPALVSAPH